MATLNGTAGNDSLVGTSYGDTIFGLDGNDTLSGGFGSSFLDGGAGNDSLRGYFGPDTLIGGDGADTISGLGSDSISAGAGDDRVSFLSIGNSPANIDLGAGNDSLDARWLEGGTIFGRDGDDTIIAGAGVSIDGGAGNDMITAGESFLTADTASTINGGDGADVILLLSSARVAGGAGSDLIVLADYYAILNNEYLGTPLPSIVVTDFQPGALGDALDTTVVLRSAAYGYDGSNPFGSAGYLRLRQEGADTVVEMDRNGGADTFIEIARLEGVIASALTASNFGFNPDGSPAPGQSLIGTAAADTMTGLIGADTIQGLAGNDSLFGGSGADSLDGGTGNDTLNGDLGNDTLLGGDDNDSLVGSRGDDLLNGGAGNDSLEGDDGADILIGGSGSDIFNLWWRAGTNFDGWSTLTAATAIADFNRAEGDRLKISNAATSTIAGAADAGTIEGLFSSSDSNLALVFSGSTNMPVAAPTAGMKLPSQPLFGLPANQTFWIPALPGNAAAAGWVVVDLDRDSVLGGLDLVFAVAASGNPLTITAADFITGTFLTSASATAPTGTTGNDSLRGGSYGESFIATPGSDAFDGGAGAGNVLDYRTFAGPVSVAFSDYAAGTVSKPGGATDSFTQVTAILGTSAADTFDARNFPTTSFFVASLFGGSGADTIIGNGSVAVQVSYTTSTAAVDIDLAAGTAKDGFGFTDTLSGIVRVNVQSSYNDTVRGSALNDSFQSSSNGSKLFDGRGGEDDYRYAASTAVTIRLGTSQDANGNWIGSATKSAGTDTLISIERARGGGGNDSILGSAADNRLAGNEGADTLDGAGGYDIVFYDTWSTTITPSAPVTLNLTTGTATDPWGNADVLLNIEAAFGTQLGDDLTGIDLGATRSFLRGLAGNDLLRAPVAGTAVTADYATDPLGILANLATGLVQDGWGGTDQLFLIRSLRGSAFADSITGSSGNDSIEGGAGHDIAIFSGTRAQTTLTHNADGTWTATGPDGTDLLTGIELLRFADGDRGLATAPRDFDGSGTADILFRATDGSVALWQMNGLASTGGGALYNPGAAWTVAGTGDFDGDGKADILWRDTTGNVALWQMNGTTYLGGGSVANVPLAWSIAGIADFNGDGRADILWRNADGSVAQWWMNGTAGLGGGGLYNPGTAWQVAATADFNGDGRADILWRNADGSVALWLLDGTTGLGGGTLYNPGSGWSIAGTGDFNGDGKADIVWRDAGGALVQWWMDGATYLGGGGFGTVGADRTVAAISDFDGDGKADILWRNDDGSLAMWQMDGLSTKAMGSLYNPGANWAVVG